MPAIHQGDRGHETLRLNLFDDAAVDVRIDRVRPTDEELKAMLRRANELREVYGQ